MSFVKIGDTYFNPQRIDYIKPDAYKIDNEWVPNVEVWIDGKEHTFWARHLDISLPVFTEKWEAKGVADAMVAKVVAMVNEALQ